MLKTNEYFEGKVKSIALKNAHGDLTIGVMDVGEYEFSTSSKEHMTVVSGVLIVKLPKSQEWEYYKASETFIVEANQKFGVKAEQQTAYICRYE